MQVVVNMLSIIASLVLLSILVTIHEIGHYSMGRLLGFHIEEFAVGLGPKILKKEKNGILYTLRALPIGGMCRFDGEDEAMGSFMEQRPWKRLLVVLGGPITNLLSTFLLAAILLTGYGEIVSAPTIVSLSADIPRAAEAGILPGDVIYAVEGEVVDNFASVSDMIQAAKGKDITITVLRGEDTKDLIVRDVYDEAAGRNVIGVQYSSLGRRVNYTLFQAVGRSVPFIFSIIRETVISLLGMFQTGLQEGDVMGVVGTVALISEAVRTDFEIVMLFAILISISLAIFNLLPIPALDGGRAIFILLEMVRGKPIAPEKEGMVHMIGFALLMGLVVLITFSDIRMLFLR